MQSQQKPPPIKPNTVLHGALKTSDSSALDLQVDSRTHALTSTSNTDESANATAQRSNGSVPVRKRGSIYPHWKTWLARTSVKLWEAVALSKNINPSKLSKIEEKNPLRYRNYRARLKTTASWLNNDLMIQEHPDNGSASPDKMVKLVDFIKCAEEKGMKVAPALLAISRANDKDRPIDSKPEISEQRSKKVTERNEKLQEAADRIASELKNKGKTIVTKRKVSEALHRGEWKECGKETIQRNIKVTW